jgi:hypothetical protein
MEILRAALPWIAYKRTLVGTALPDGIGARVRALDDRDLLQADEVAYVPVVEAMLAVGDYERVYRLVSQKMFVNARERVAGPAHFVVYCRGMYARERLAIDLDPDGLTAFLDGLQVYGSPTDLEAARRHLELLRTTMAYVGFRRAPAGAALPEDLAARLRDLDDDALLAADGITYVDALDAMVACGDYERAYRLVRRKPSPDPDRPSRGPAQFVVARRGEAARYCEAIDLDPDGLAAFLGGLEDEAREEDLGAAWQHLEELEGR